MNVFVLDASIILCFLLEEKAAVVDKLAHLFEQVQRGKTKLYSSPLLLLEVGNGLRFTLKDEKLASETFKIFLKLPIDYVQFSNVQLQAVLSQSYALGTSFYDASYHVLAKSRRAIFITTDKDYYQKAKHLDSISFV